MLQARHATPPRRPGLAHLGLVLLTACNAEQAPPNGMTRAFGLPLPGTAGTPHATTLLPFGSDLVVLDSNGVVRVTSAGGELQARVLAILNSPRCTVGVLSGRHVLCGSHGDSVIEAIDLDRGVAVSRFAATPDPQRGTFGMALQAGELWVATAAGTLEALALGADGVPDAARRRVVARGSFRTLVGDGLSRLAAWNAATDEVLLFDGATLQRTVPLDGPLLGGRWSGGVLLAALGSAGVARIDPGAEPPIQWRLAPPAVVTSLDVADGVLLVGSTTGAFAYDLTHSDGLPFGFVPAEYGVLDVALRGGRALVLDWRSLFEFTLDRGAEATALDTPRGYVVAPDRTLAVPMRNVGRASRTINGTLIAPGATVRVSALALDRSGSSTLQDRTGSVSLTVAGSTSSTPPRLGEPWPFDPQRFASSQLFLVESTCALQYPLWKDLGYRLRHPAPGALPVVIGLIDAPDAAARWSDLWALPGRAWSELVALPPGTDAARALGVTHLIGGPDTDAVYELDAAGRVIGFDNQWRGPHALPSPL